MIPLLPPERSGTATCAALDTGLLDLPIRWRRRLHHLLLPNRMLRSLLPLLPALAAGSSLSAQQGAPLRFELTLPTTAASAMRQLGLELPAYGRAYVIVTRDSTRQPRQQVDVAGVPFWGMDVAAWRPGSTITLADSDDVFGYPLRRFADLPAGAYFVQAFLNVYTTFQRADGHSVRLHQDQGEGQDPWRSPGNAYSPVQRVQLDPATGGAVRLVLSEIVPPIDPAPPGGTLQQGNPADRPQVRFVKIRSELLSKFWGRDMYIGANVLLPRDYESQPDRRYPAIYLQGHYPGSGAPFGFGEVRSRQSGAAGAGGNAPANAAGGNALANAAGSNSARAQANPFAAFWLSDAAPPLVAITIRDANPFYDTSYSVNSANLGPYGDAIMQELIPYLERQFRLIPEREARLLAGGSTGGWEALAMQIFYPDQFAGAWGWCPDAVDFHYHQIVNIYDDQNAYTLDRGWLQVERPGMRRPDGNIMYSMRDENLFEHAVGTRARSAGQWAIWEAVYGPPAEDGYPRPLWDPLTGEIDPATATYWQQHYDLTDYLRRNWSTLGPKLSGRLHVAVGAADSYYLDDAVYLLQQFLDSTSELPARATFEYGARKPHCWIGYSREQPGQDLGQPEFVRIIGEYLKHRTSAEER